MNNLAAMKLHRIRGLESKNYSQITLNPVAFIYPAGCWSPSYSPVVGQATQEQPRGTTGRLGRLPESLSVALL